MPGRYIYAWPQPVIVCQSNEDATALALMFGGHRVETKIEKMIKNEEDND